MGLLTAAGAGGPVGPVPTGGAGVLTCIQTAKVRTRTSHLEEGAAPPQTAMEGTPRHTEALLALSNSQGGDPRTHEDPVWACGLARVGFDNIEMGSARLKSKELACSNLRSSWLASSTEEALCSASIFRGPFLEPCRPTSLLEGSRSAFFCNNPCDSPVIKNFSIVKTRSSWISADGARSRKRLRSD